MFKKLLVLFSLVASTVLGTTFSNVQFETVSSNVNFISTRAITNQTAWIKSVLTNGAIGGSNVERLLVPAFEPNASIKLTNVNILAVFDNSAATNLYTVPYNQNYSTCFENEDVKHTTNFIMSTNARFGRFDISVAGTRVEEGNVMVIDNRYYPIRKISNLGTNVDEVELMYRVYGEPRNTTQIVQAIYGLNFNSNNVSYGDFDGTNDSFRLVGSSATAGNYPWIGNSGNFSYYNLTNEEFLIIRDPRWWIGAGGALPQEASVVFKYSNNAWKEWGSTAWRFTTLQAGQTIDTPNGTTYWSSFQQYVSSAIYKSTNKLTDRRVISMPLTTYWSRVTSTKDDSIIYACTHSIWMGSISGNGGFIYKSTNDGVTWTALSNMGSRYWSAIMCIDGTNIYAGTNKQGGSGTSASGGLFYSADGGSTVITTSLRNATYGANMQINDIWLNAASNVVVCNQGSTSSTNNGIWISNLNGTNFTRWTTNIFSANHFIPHATDTNVYYFIGDYTLGGITNNFYIAKITNSAAVTNYITPTDEAVLKGVDYRGVCFSPVNPNIGYICYNRITDSAGNGRILKTTDRGRTWTDVAPVNAYWTSVATYDGQTVYAAISRHSQSQQAANGGIGRIYYSTNGGTSWSTIDRSLKTWVKLIMPSSNTVYGMAKWTENNLGSTAISVMYELATSNNIISLYKGRYSGGSGNFPQIYFRNGILYWIMNLSGAVGYGTILQSYDYGETWDDIYQFSANYVGAGVMPYSVAMSTGVIGYAAHNGFGIYTTNNWTNMVVTTDSGRNRTGVWINDNASTIYYTLTYATPCVIKSTNSGSTWITAFTNGPINASIVGITSPDNGDTIVIGSNVGTIGIVTNMLVNPTQSNLTFIAGSPSCYYLRSIDSNTIFAGSTTANTINYSTNKGFNWISKIVNFNDITNRTIYSVEIDSRDITSNSYWMSTSYGLYYTTNFFNTAYLWATNYYQQLFTQSGSFCVAINNTNVTAMAYESGRILISTNAGKTYTIPNFMLGLSKSWTGITSYDGNILYVASGYYAETDISDYLYKIDLKNNSLTYLDNWRDRRWTDINTADGKDIWATTRIELHKNTTPPIPTNYYSIVTTCTAPTSTSWINIQDTLATLNTYNDSFGETYFTFSFDNNKSYVKWESANWRAVVTNDSGWKYWNGSTYISAYTNSATAALSGAMQYTTNQMTYTQTTGISPTNWIGFLGFNTNLTSNIYVGVTMRSQSNEIPNIQSLSFDYSAEGDNFRKKNAVTDGYKIEYEPTNGVYTIRRTGTATDTYIYYIRK